ncbi:MAG TPA: nucleotidyltransferase family protein [Candidatus Limnocylindria bacterium]|nr:nucleotidyltransferase family protein [Candidatus Limnocylindria bacterium]
MRVCGVIAEYDPFHNGHQYQLAQARERTGADYSVCVLGCAFSQRGDAMLFSSHDRARMALLGGHDLVLGMPFSFSCAQANRFARGGVGILNGLGVVTDISFGCETDRLDLVYAAARLLDEPDGAFQGRLRRGLDEGRSFAHARGAALEEAFADVSPALLRSPNFILGVCYVRELARLRSSIRVTPVRRETGYHSLEAGPTASASAVRAMLLRGDFAGATEACPGTTARAVREAMDGGRMHRPDALDAALIAALLRARPEDLRRSPEVSEGLEDRILAAAREATGRAGLAEAVRTRRYPRPRVSRALSHALVGANVFPPEPAYARLLGFRRGAAPLLQAIGGRFPLVSRPARSPFPETAQDMRAEELWMLGSGQAPAQAWRNGVVIID